jgi:hypothetical protein
MVVVPGDERDPALAEGIAQTLEEGPHALQDPSDGCLAQLQDVAQEDDPLGAFHRGNESLERAVPARHVVAADAAEVKIGEDGAAHSASWWQQRVTKAVPGRSVYVMARVIILAGLVVTLALAAAETASACSCVQIAPETKLRQSDGAVVARLLRVEPLESSQFSANFVYRTGRVLKGKPRLRRGRRLVVRSPLSSASCGLMEREGRLTGLFLTRDDGRWSSNSCNEVSAAVMRSLKRATAACA